MCKNSFITRNQEERQKVAKLMAGLLPLAVFLSLFAYFVLPTQPNYEPLVAKCFYAISLLQVFIAVMFLGDAYKVADEVKARKTFWLKYGVFFAVACFLVAGVQFNGDLEAKLVVVFCGIAGIIFSLFVAKCIEKGSRTDK